MEFDRKNMFVVTVFLFQAAFVQKTAVCEIRPNPEMGRQVSVQTGSPEVSTSGSDNSQQHDAEMTSEDTLLQLAPNAAAVLENFDVLVRLARTEAAGPKVVSQMAEAIRETQPGAQKQEALTRLFEYLRVILKEGHESIAGHEALRLMGEALFNPRFSVRPSWGLGEARKIFEQNLRNPDYRIRNQAFHCLFRTALVLPAEGEEILAKLHAQFELEEQADDYGEDPSFPPGYLKERALAKMEQCFETMAGRKWSDLQVITDDDYGAMKKMDREKLLELVPRGGIEGAFAVSSLLSGGCDDYTMDRLIDIARHTAGPPMSSLISRVARAVARPIKDNVATAEDRGRLERFTQVLAKELESPESNMGRAAVKGLYSVVSSFEYDEARGIHRYAPESDPAIRILESAMDHPNQYVRQDAIRDLGHIAVIDSNRTSSILESLQKSRNKILAQAPSPDRETTIETLDASIRQVQRQLVKSQ